MTATERLPCTRPLPVGLDQIVPVTGAAFAGGDRNQIIGHGRILVNQRIATFRRKIAVRSTAPVWAVTLKPCPGKS